MMRCVTRLSLDGLVCAMLLEEVQQTQDVILADPKPLLDQTLPPLLRLGSGDVLASLPYYGSTRQWYSHHISEALRLEQEDATALDLQDGCQPEAPSSARIIWESFGPARFPAYYQEWVQTVDLLEQGGFPPNALVNPPSALMLGFLLDAESQAMDQSSQPLASRFGELVRLCRRQPAGAVLHAFACLDAWGRVHGSALAYAETISAQTTRQQGVLLTDLRGQDPLPHGVPSQDFLLFPKATSQIRLTWDASRENVRITLRHSPFLPRHGPSIGELLAGYGGFGHHRAGVCEVYAPLADAAVRWLVAALAQA